MSKTGTLIGILRKNKYWIVIVIAIVFVGFVDENSLWRHQVNQYKIREIQSEIDKYNQRTKESNEILRRLKTDPAEARRIAREQYLMKQEDEDIYVFQSDIDREAEEKAQREEEAR